MDEPSLLVLKNLQDVRWAARRATQLNPQLRAVVATYIPTGMVPVFAGLGMLALEATSEQLDELTRAKEVSFAPTDTWSDGQIEVKLGSESLQLRWLAIGTERAWTTQGSALVQAAE